MKSFFDWFRETVKPTSARKQQEEQGEIQATEMKVDSRLDRFKRVAETNIASSRELDELVKELIEDSKRENRNAKISSRPKKN